MRDRIFLAVFLLGSGLLLYVGRNFLVNSVWATVALTFGGTTAAAIFGMALYRVQLELRASRHELARKEAELNFALEVQRALFPREFPAGRGLEFAGICLPARGISGDYYDVLPLKDGRLGFVIADISGKGISAAILMSNLHAGLRTLAEAGLSPGEMFSQLNRHLYRIADHRRFATMFYAEWDAAQRRLSYINAGHNPPVLWSSESNRGLDQGGLPLGILLAAAYQPGTVALQPGDLIALYSDGITEAVGENGDLFGESRLEAVIAAHRRRPLAEIQEQVLAAVREFAGEEPADDITLLLVRATTTQEERT